MVLPVSEMRFKEGRRRFLEKSVNVHLTTQLSNPDDSDKGAATAARTSNPHDELFHLCTVRELHDILCLVSHSQRYRKEIKFHGCYSCYPNLNKTLIICGSCTTSPPLRIRYIFYIVRRAVTATSQTNVARV